jgi:hypothetical protein
LKKGRRKNKNSEFKKGEKLKEDLEIYFLEGNLITTGIM